MSLNVEEDQDILQTNSTENQPRTTDDKNWDISRQSALHSPEVHYPWLSFAKWIYMPKEGKADVC